MPYRTPYRGEVWFARLGSHEGTSVQEGYRPVLIVSNDKSNHHSSTLVVLPMTTRMKKFDLPAHVELYHEDLSLTDPAMPLEPSMILAEQITTIPKSSLCIFLGKVEEPSKLQEIGDAIKAQLGMKEM